MTDELDDELRCTPRPISHVYNWLNGMFVQAYKNGDDQAAVYAELSEAVKKAFEKYSDARRI